MEIVIPEEKPYLGDADGLGWPSVDPTSTGCWVLLLPKGLGWTGNLTGRHLVSS